VPSDHFQCTSTLSVTDTSCNLISIHYGGFIFHGNSLKSNTFIVSAPPRWTSQFTLSHQYSTALMIKLVIINPQAWSRRSIPTASVYAAKDFRRTVPSKRRLRTVPSSLTSTASKLFIFALDGHSIVCSSPAQCSTARKKLGLALCRRNRPAACHWPAKSCKPAHPPRPRTSLQYLRFRQGLTQCQSVHA
jgi:hypothetical protein